jgi:hypothetical protein
MSEEIVDRIGVLGGICVTGIREIGKSKQCFVVS